MASGTPVARTSEAFRALRERFRETSGAILSRLEECARALAADADDAGVLAMLPAELADVAERASANGFADVGALASALASRAQRWREGNRHDRDRRATMLGHFAAALRLSLTHEVPGGRAHAARRRMLLVDVPAPVARTIRSTAALRGYQLATARLDELGPTHLRALAPHVVVTPGSALAAVQEHTTGAGIPVVALRRADEPPPEPLRRDTPHAVHALGGDTGTLFDAADRLCVGSSWMGATVLVLDEDPSILSIVRHLLEAEGIRAFTCEDPRQLPHELSRSAPSLLLIEERLGAVSGLDIAREVRGMAAYADVPILLLSSGDDEATRAGVRVAGIDDLVAKPIVAADLLERIAGPLERQRLARLAEGRHPGTGIALAPRTVADAAERLREAERDGRRMTAAFVRHDAAELGAEAAADWLCETQRLAGALAGPRGGVGYVDGVSLFSLFDGEAEEAEALFAALAAAPGPEWRVAIVGTDAVGHDITALRRAAEDVLGIVRASGDARVIRWRREEARRAPDVVIVEDDPAIAEMIQYVLRLSSLSYRHFRAGDAALEALLSFETHEERPLVLLGGRLPGLDGHELFAALGARRPGDFAVVFLTDEHDAEPRLRALRAGALDYVQKPVSYRTLLGKVPLWRERARVLASAEGSA